MPAARIAKALGIRRHHPVASVRRLQAKDRQRDALGRAGVPVPAWTVIRRDDRPPFVLDGVPFPVVAKPVYGFASKSTFLAHHHDELAAGLADARAVYDHDPFVAGHPADFVVEELLHGERWHDDPRLGDYVSVETIVDDGVPVHLAVTDKFPLASGFRETGDAMPSALPAERLDAVQQMTSAALRALGATFGAAHTELKLTAEGPRIIEVNGRIGGGVANLLDAAFGYDVVTTLGRLALGIDSEWPAEAVRHVAWVHPQAPPEANEIVAVDGLDRVRLLDGILTAEVAEPGKRYDARAGESRYASVRFVADSRAELMMRRERILDSLVVETRQAPA
jgi:biotin carboxylase